MQSGLPVLANVNAGNDLSKMIIDERVGQVCETNQVDDLLQLTERLIDHIGTDSGVSVRCTSLFEREFSVEKTVKQIILAFSAERVLEPWRFLVPNIEIGWWNKPGDANANESIPIFSNSIKISTSVLFKDSANHFRDRVFINPYVDHEVMHVYKYKTLEGIENTEAMEYVLEICQSHFNHKTR